MAFEFPKPIPLDKRLKDVLESHVDDKYYLSDEQVASFKASTTKAQAKGNGFKFKPFERERESNCTRHHHKGGQPSDGQLYKGAIRLGGLYDQNGKKHQAGSVYDPRGVAATLSTMQGGNQEPIIVASRGRGEPPMQTLEPNKTGTTNAITSVAKDNYLAEPCGRVEIVEDFYKNRPAQHYDKTSPTIRADRQGLKVAIRTANQKGYDLAENGDSFRIRKLTPLECWRLMGFDDEDFRKAEKVNSNSQLYKQAGNSIVVNVLESILRRLLDDKEE